MHGDADIVRRLWRAAWLRRLPLWVLGALPWLALRTAARLAGLDRLVHVGCGAPAPEGRARLGELA